MATGCHAFIDVPKAELNHLSASWNDVTVREISIGYEENLHLFTIESSKDSRKILWLTQSDYLEEAGKYDDVENYMLTVKLASNNAYVPQPFTKKIGEIISQATSTKHTSLSR